MPRIAPTGQNLGAAVTGIDLSQPMSDGDFTTIVMALGEHGVLRFPGQDLSSQAVKDFSERFGSIQASIRSTGELPPSGVHGVGLLSNVKQDGKYIGSHDAGQDWHTDMSYRTTMGFVNVLYGITIPKRDGRTLGGTEFRNTQRAYEALPAGMRDMLRDATVTHDFNKFWDHMRHDKGSTRPPLTDEQRALRPPVVHPLFLTHPVTGRKVLYCNPGYAIRINELPEAESAAILDYLFAFQLRAEFAYLNVWTERDLLIWDNIGTIHRAIADYGPEEHRLIKRCQVMADRIFDPGFQAQVLPPRRAA